MLEKGLEVIRSVKILMFETRYKQKIISSEDLGQNVWQKA